ncbi:MAG TPA: hypothetical protein VFJ06_04730 [Halococcus sp.]|nr:hypothetical protein [Halococcus sp.]
MVELEERVLSAAKEREALSVDDLLRLVQQHHSPDEPGVAHDTLMEYGRALTDANLTLDARSDPLRGTAPEFTDGTLEHELDERLTDDESWVGEDALYELDDDRVSIYPAPWHDALDGTTDLTECIRFIRDESGFKEAPGVGTGTGVPEELVLDVATVIGGFSPEEASTRLEERKEQGEIIEDRTTAQGSGLSVRGESDDELPPMLDIRDALDDIETSAESDVSDDINDVRQSLAEFNERDRANQESLLTDIEDRLVGLRESLAGDADRRVEGIINRIQQYRTADESTALSLSGTALLDDKGDAADIAALTGEVATFDGTVVNGGESREAVEELTLYAADDTPIKTIETQAFSLASDEHHAIEQRLYIPENAAYYATAAFDAADSRAITDDRPT